MEKKETQNAAGLIAYKRENGILKIFLVHNGGPYFAKKDARGWSFPKGHAHEGEDLLECAKREFKEETSFEIPDAEFVNIGSITSKGKTVHAWAFKHEYDPSEMKSNTTTIEWPPRSGKQMEIPEVDRGEYVDLNDAHVKIFAYLEPLITKFEEKII